MARQFKSDSSRSQDSGLSTRRRRSVTGIGHHLWPHSVIANTSVSQTEDCECDSRWGFHFNCGNKPEDAIGAHNAGILLGSMVGVTPTSATIFNCRVEYVVTR